MASAIPTPSLSGLDPVIRIGSVVGLAAGIALIILGNTGQGILGVLLVIVALVSLMAVVHNALSQDQTA